MISTYDQSEVLDTLVANRLSRFMNPLRDVIKSTQARCGFERRRTHPLVERPHYQFIREKGIACVLNICANIGQSIALFRERSFAGPIFAIEPISLLFEKLSERVSADGNATAVAMPVGDIGGFVKMNVSAGHVGATSILPLTERALNLTPNQAVIRTKEVPIHTLDWLCEAFYPKGNQLFIKLDIQSFVKQCIVGAKKSLQGVAGIKAEMSFTPNYLEESTLKETLPQYSLGFAPVFVEDGSRNPNNGELLQCDIRFQRQS